MLDYFESNNKVQNLPQNLFFCNVSVSSIAIFLQNNKLRRKIFLLKIIIYVKEIPQNTD